MKIDANNCKKWTKQSIEIDKWFVIMLLVNCYFALYKTFVNQNNNSNEKQTLLLS